MVVVEALSGSSGRGLFGPGFAEPWESAPSTKSCEAVRLRTAPNVRRSSPIAPAMTCSEFHDRFSDYYDGTAEPSLVGDVEAHLENCAECRHFHAAVVEGGKVLRTLPPVTVSEDFFPRLQHRIFHLEDGPALGHAEAGSGSTVSAAVAVAALIALAAWSPALMRPRTVALDPIVVTRPEPRVHVASAVPGVKPPVLWTPPATSVALTPTGYTTLPYSSATYNPTAYNSPAAYSHAAQGLWDDPSLLTRYSPLMGPAVQRVTLSRPADFF